MHMLLSFIEEMFAQDGSLYCVSKQVVPLALNQGHVFIYTVWCRHDAVNFLHNTLYLFILTKSLQLTWKLGNDKVPVEWFH